MNLESMILRNMNQYIETEGLKRKRLAKRMNMSESNFSDYLNGKRMNGIYDFAAKLADTLGHEQTFFMNDSFHHLNQEIEEGAFAFSAGNMLSERGKEGLAQLTKICDLLEIYDRGDSHA
ncbi:helix-turn-helix transcriptional regulator [Bacillus sp. S13(2024)]|uniref:XRE family transcriptional regulator n=1 Tax=unclassified Bacillus (in: firmicutes) TaxID=185979 RepID=UPI003D1B41C8